MDISLEGWDFGKFAEVEWGPWGSGGNARAKVLAAGDGYSLALVEADAGYEGDPHEHAFTEFLYLIDGAIRNQGQALTKGDGYVAAPGSTHADFGTATGATYLSIFKP